jgi:hypothetical protein
MKEEQVAEGLFLLYSLGTSRYYRRSNNREMFDFKQVPEYICIPSSPVPFFFPYYNTDDDCYPSL